MSSITSRADHRRFTYKLARTTAIISLIALVVLIISQLYVRWNINQNFTLLGGNELETLTVSVFALVIGLVYTHREERDE
jgi:hypothetical protein